MIDTRALPASQARNPRGFRTERGRRGVIDAGGASTSDAAVKLRLELAHGWRTRSHSALRSEIPAGSARRIDHRGSDHASGQVQVGGGP